jgi:hypothetical protein
MEVPSLSFKLGIVRLSLAIFELIEGGFSKRDFGEMEKKLKGG